MVNYTVSEENYIKTIYHLQQGATAVNTNDLAASLLTTAASITDMLKKLKAKKLVNYKPYYGCTLTAKGNAMAISIIRRHRLWEYFLSQKLGFSWLEVHEIAEELEHVSNEKLINKLDEYLGFPRFDPHGDPIPDANGKIQNISTATLTNVKQNQTATVTQIGNQSHQILEMLQVKKIAIGTRVKVLQKFPFDGSIEVQTDGKHTTHLTKELSDNIFIK